MFRQRPFLAGEAGGHEAAEGVANHGKIQAGLIEPEYALHEEP